jgi:cytoskeletal protein RodZ
MTRTDVVASSRPQKADAAPSRKGSSSALRKLAVLPVAFALMMAFVLPTGAFAAEEGLSNYNNKPSTTPTTPTTSTPATTPTSGTSPEKAESTPTKTTAPEEKAKEPAKTTTTTSEPAKASTLPFTGFDLRWTVAAGVLLLAMGFSIVVAQRRQGRKGER